MHAAKVFPGKVTIRAGYGTLDWTAPQGDWTICALFQGHHGKMVERAGPGCEVVGKCPRCGGEVAELQKGFFCQNDSCKFAIWKNNKWWAAKKKQPTKAVVSALLNDGRVRVTGLYSEKTGKTYDAAVVLEDDGQYANFKLEFDQRKGGSR